MLLFHTKTFYEIHKLSQNRALKPGDFDPMVTEILRQCFDELLPYMLTIIIFKNPLSTTRFLMSSRSSDETSSEE